MLGEGRRDGLFKCNDGKSDDDISPSSKGQAWSRVRGTVLRETRSFSRRDTHGFLWQENFISMWYTIIL